MTDPRGDKRWVLDTNVIVSRAVRPHGIAALAFDAAARSGKVLVSVATLAELNNVLVRPKFNRYLSAEDRRAFLAGFAVLLDFVSVERPIRACRDPKDDKFLEVAVHGHADALITGDEDLLALHPFHDVPILTPQNFLALHAPAAPT